MRKNTSDRCLSFKMSRLNSLKKIVPNLPRTTIPDHKMVRAYVIFNPGSWCTSLVSYLTIVGTNYICIDRFIMKSINIGKSRSPIGGCRWHIFLRIMWKLLLLENQNEMFDVMICLDILYCTIVETMHYAMLPVITTLK